MNDVLFVINSLAPGGTEQSTVQLAPMLAERGWRTTIVPLRAAEHELTGRALADGTQVLAPIDAAPATQARRIRQLVRSEEPALVHTALFDADVIGRVAAVGTGTPVVSSLVNTPYDPSRLRDPNVDRVKLGAVRIVDAATARLATAFHAVSAGVGAANARALRLPTERIIVAERGRRDQGVRRSDERRARLCDELGLDEGIPLVLSVGRQEHQKAQERLVQAVATIRDEFPAVLLIAGRAGNATETLRAEIEHTPMASDFVRVLGHRSDVLELIAGVDVVAISSHFEGTAGVAIEAMSVGTPIVVPDLEGLRGILTDGENALITRSNTPADLAAGIRLLLRQPALQDRLAAAGRADFEGRFTLDRAADRMSELYARVVAGSAPTRRATSARSPRR